MNKQDFEDINKRFQDYSNALSFITEYILYFRFADLASHPLSVPIPTAPGIDSVIEDYQEDVEELFEDFENRIKQITKKETVSNYLKNDNLFGYKKKIDEQRTILINQIISLYNEAENYRKKTAGKNSDYMIYSDYMSYLSDFRYDENNPYVVELYDKISSFLQARTKCEATADNIPLLISKFTNLCDQVLSPYWSSNNKDYYSRIKDQFQYDFYADSDDMIEAKIDDEGRVTLYKKVLDYLKNVTHFQKPSDGNTSFTADPEGGIEGMKALTDSIMNKSNNSSSSNDELENKLKKISMQFVMIKRIESDKLPEYFTSMMDQDNLNDIFNLMQILQTMGLTLDEFEEACVINPALRLTYGETVTMFLDSMSSMTAEEARILRELSDKAINWYNENSGDIESGRMFDQYKECSWSKQSLIYKDKKPHDFFFVDLPQTSSGVDDGNDVSMQDTSDSSMGLLTSGHSENDLLTDYHITDYLYWLRYCTVASLVNCMAPIYWATGFISPAGPLLLPIIFIPIIVIPGTVITVIGIGLCGIFPCPMILCYNISDSPATMIAPITMLINLIKDLPKKIMKGAEAGLLSLIKGLIEANEAKIKSKQDEMKEIDQKIANLKAGVETDKETLRALKKANKKDSTSNTENGSE